MAENITKDSLKEDIFNAYLAEKSAKEAAETALNELKNAPVLITPEDLAILKSNHLALISIFPETPEFNDKEVSRIKSLIQQDYEEAQILRKLFPDVTEFGENFVEDFNKLEETAEPVTVVIPYIKEFAQGNELQLALRGWDKHFKEDFRVVVIGDREDWMNDDVHVIECKRKGNNPPIDIAHKMLLAIESDLVSEKFIWANDDQYLVSPCMLPDFEILTCDGMLNAANLPNNLYGKNKKLTIDLLKKAGKGMVDFSTHTPFVFEKDKLKDLIIELDLTKNARLISSLYYNWYFPGFVPLRITGGDANDNMKVGVYRQDANFGKLKQFIPLKKIVSNSQSGWSKSFAKIMNATLPDKCQFEK